MGVINISSGIEARKGKELVANAVTEKGIPTSTTASFEEIAKNIKNSMAAPNIITPRDIALTSNDFEVSDSNSKQKGSCSVSDTHIYLTGPNTPYYSGDKNKTGVVFKKTINLTGKSKLFVIQNGVYMEMKYDSTNRRGLKLLSNTNYSCYNMSSTPTIYQGMDISNYNGNYYLGFYDETSKDDILWSDPQRMYLYYIILI